MIESLTPTLVTTPAALLRMQRRRAAAVTVGLDPVHLRTPPPPKRPVAVVPLVETTAPNAAGRDGIHIRVHTRLDAREDNVEFNGSAVEIESCFGCNVSAACQAPASVNELRGVPSFSRSSFDGHQSAAAGGTGAGGDGGDGPLPHGSVGVAPLVQQYLWPPMVTPVGYSPVHGKNPRLLVQHKGGNGCGGLGAGGDGGRGGIGAPQPLPE